jgi:hypothetical protein
MDVFDAEPLDEGFLAAVIGLGAFLAVTTFLLMVLMTCDALPVRSEDCASDACGEHESDGVPDRSGSPDACGSSRDACDGQDPSGSPNTPHSPETLPTSETQPVSATQ